jgi:energy-coupling factor transporter ATP-binding protein EcfA2
MTPVFERLQINGYRGLKAVELLQLGQVNIFVGNNNSGKTSLLEAISILCNPLDPFQWLEVAQRRSYIGRTPILPPRNIEILKWIFPQDLHSGSDEFYQGEIIIHASGTSSIQKLNVHLEEIYGNVFEDVNQANFNKTSAILSASQIQSETIEQADQTRLSEDALSSEAASVHSGIEISVIAHLGRNQSNLPPDKQTSETTFQFWENERFIRRSRSEPFVNSATISPFHTSGEPIAYRLTQIIKKEPEGKRLILELIQQFDENIVDLQILSMPTGGATLYINHKVLGIAPLYTFGDGLKKTLIIALTLLTIKNGVLLIDEIETSIHVSALTKIFSWLVETCRQQHTQLFVTTHSLEAIDAMLQTELATDDLVAFRLNSRNQPPQRFSSNLLHRLRSERGLDVR